MIRSTTPRHEFIIPLDAQFISNIWITYEQDGEIVLEKHMGDMQHEGELWFYKLTQDETKQFKAEAFVRIQVKVLTTGGDVMASDVLRTPVEDVLNDEVMV